ncbi:MAG: DUF4193 family protein [Acidimicrobiales bacterium]
MPDEDVDDTLDVVGAEDPDEEDLADPDVDPDVDPDDDVDVDDPLVLDDDTDDDTDDEDILDVDLTGLGAEDVGSTLGTPVAAVAAAGEEEEDDDDEDDTDEDDVEASLDVILKEKLVVADEDDEDDAGDGEDRAEISTKVLPPQPDEFLCVSCLLLKRPSQLANPRGPLCRDCV